jgi:hypothetical protein
MRIQQAHISKSLDLFRDGFMSRWNIVPYHDCEAPALFVGIYSSVDVAKFNDHNGLKIVLFGGADMPNIKCLKGNFFVVCDEFSYDHSLSNYYSGKVKKIRIPFKDYSDFKPVPLGNKIYCYQAGQSSLCGAKYRYDILKEVIKYFGSDKVIVGYQGHDIDYVRENYYAKSFVNLQLNPMAGFTSALEMAHMGRLSISNHRAPFCIHYKDVADIILKIESIERNRLTADPSGFLHESDDWLYTEYWKS